MQTEEKIVVDDEVTRNLDNKWLGSSVSGEAYIKSQTENPVTVLEPHSSLAASAEFKEQCDIHCVEIVSPQVNISDVSALENRVKQQQPQTARKSFTKVDGRRIRHNSSEDDSLQLIDRSQNSDGEEKLSAKILNFNCPKCKDNVKYSPNDLHKHYQLLHHGELPTYPCEMCSFSANDFHLFKQHRQKHKNTLVKCEICNDGSIYSLLDLTKHFSSEHCANGFFLCDKCKFSTKDVGTFVQHLHKHNTSYSCVKCLPLQVEDKSQNFDGEEKVSAKILNFNCPKCKDNVKYSPNDLHKHYQLLHHGEMPTYPCEMCSFSANDFHLFKQHRQKHKNTLVKCEICSDDRIYSLLDLTKHFSSVHCANGSYLCEKCKFSTKDVGTFVQHFHKHNTVDNTTDYSCVKCHHVSLTKEAFQKHLLVHSGVFPFTCPYCDYGATSKEHVLQHIESAHKKHVSSEVVDHDSAKSTGLKLVLKRCQTETSKKSLWKQKSTKQGTNEGVEVGLENSASLHISSNWKSLCNGETYLDSTSKQGIRIFTTSLNKQNVQGTLVPSNTVQQRKAENGSSANLGVMKDAVHGPTVLMVQNSRISVPANYSAKFVGFKVVNGKQHLVIKLLPTNKNSVYSLGLQTQNGTTNESNNLFQNTVSNNLVTSSKPENPSLCDIMHKTSKYENKQPLFPPYSLTVKQSTEMTGAQNDICLEAKKELPSVVRETMLLSRSSNQTFVSVSEAQDNLQSGSCVLLNEKTLESVENALQLEEKHALQKEQVVCESKVEDTTSISADPLNQKILPFHNYSKYISFKLSDAYEKPGSSLPDTIADSDQTHFLQNGEGISVNRSPDDCHSSALKSDCLSEQPAIVDAGGALGSHPICGDAALRSKNDAFLNSKDLNQKCENVNHNDQQLGDDSQTVISNKDSPFMPKIMSVFSLQSESVPSFLSPEANNLLNDAQSINFNKTFSLQNRDERNYNEPCRSLTREAPFAHSEDSVSKDPKVDCTDSSEVHLPITKDPSSESTFVEEQSSSLMSACPQLEQTFSSSPKNPVSSIGAILKSFADVIITNQLVKEGICVSSQGSSSTSLGTGKVNKTISLNAKSMPDSIQPTQNIAPLHISSQPALQVSSGGLPFTTTALALQTEKLASVPSTQSSTTGLVLSFSGGPLGTVANVPGSSDTQVLTGANPNSYTNVLNTDLRSENSVSIPRTVILQKAPAAVGTLVNPVIGQVSTVHKNVGLKSENSSNRPRTILSKAALSVGNSLNAVSGPVFLLNSSSSSFSGNSVSVATPLVGQQILVGQNVSATSGTALHQGTVSSGLNTENSNSDTQQKQPLYALLPDGRQAVFVRCVAPPRPILSKGYAYLQPKNTSVGQQKILLKILRPSSSTEPGIVSQQASNVTPIKIDNSHALIRPTMQIKQSVLCPAGVVQSSPSFMLSANTVFLSSAAGSDVSLSANKLVSPTSTVAQLLRCSSGSTAGKESTNKVDGNRALSTRSKASQNETGLQQKLSGTCSVKTAGKKNKVTKRKREVIFEEPPVKKRTLPRKCKEKKKYVDIESESEHSDEDVQSEHSDTEIQSEHADIEIQSDVVHTKVAKDIVKVLRLLPFNSEQLVKCPRRNQPVVVLNHPDADVPEVANVMKTIKKFKGHVVKVSLSQRTITSLHCDSSGVSEESATTRCRRSKPVSPVKERFVLKLTLKKTSKNNYRIVKAGTENRMESSFTCWFCGRIFDNQDDWAGHGQRHLMEATRDWNVLC